MAIPMINLNPEQLGNIYPFNNKAGADSYISTGYLIAGDLAYTKDDKKLYKFDGTSWLEIGGSSNLTPAQIDVLNGDKFDASLYTKTTQLPSNDTSWRTTKQDVLTTPQLDVLSGSKFDPAVLQNYNAEVDFDIDNSSGTKEVYNPNVLTNKDASGTRKAITLDYQLVDKKFVDDTVEPIKSTVNVHQQFIQMLAGQSSELLFTGNKDGANASSNKNIVWTIPLIDSTKVNNGDIITFLMETGTGHYGEILFNLTVGGGSKTLPEAFKIPSLNPDGNISVVKSGTNLVLTMVKGSNTWYNTWGIIQVVTEKKEVLNVYTKTESDAKFQTKAITDTGNFYATDTVNDAFQEIGGKLSNMNTAISGKQDSLTTNQLDILSGSKFDPSLYTPTTGLGKYALRVELSQKQDALSSGQLNVLNGDKFDLSVLDTKQDKLTQAQLTRLNEDILHEFIKPTFAELDAVKAQAKQGDLGFVNDGTKLTGYILNNGNWEQYKDDVGGTVDLTAYATKLELAGALQHKQNILSTNQLAVVNGDKFDSSLYTPTASLPADDVSWKTTKQDKAKWLGTKTPTDTSHLTDDNVGSFFEES